MAQRRQPPEGWTYADNLAPIFRTTKQHIQQRAAAGMYKTAKQWSYTTDDKVTPGRDDGYQRGNTYTWWIITWEEYLEIVQSLVTKEPEYYVVAEVVFGPFENEGDARTHSRTIGSYLEQRSIKLKSYQPDVKKEN